jgi:hypothetical protein
MGVVFTITILSVTAVTLFIFTIVYLSNYQALDKELKQERVDTEQFVTTGERNIDEVRNIVTRAGQQRKSAIGYLVDSQKQIMEWVTGNPNDTVTDLGARLDGIPGAKTTPATRLIGDRDAQIANLQGQLATAQAAVTAAREDLQAEVDSKNELQRVHAETVERMGEQIEQQRAEVDTYRRQVQEATDNMDSRVAGIRADYEAEKSDLVGRLNAAQQTVLDLEEQLAKLRQTSRDVTLAPLPEAGLADGSILNVFPQDNYVVIGRGRADKVVLGMTFAVYSQGTTIRPGPDGTYPRGKAAIEVISIDQNSSRARIIGSTAGDPIVRGDIIANAVYDPEKIYKFVVYGNFDTNRDGIATPQERLNIEAMIDRWGGNVQDDLGGDVDFLVLGERPILPPPPPGTAQIELVREFVRLREVVERYDELLARAQSTSIPILNQNSLATLIGR